MMYLGITWTLISVICFDMCKGQYFNNTILLTTSNLGIVAIPGEKLTLKCAGTVQRQTGFKVLRLWGSTFGPVEDTHFGNETKLRVNKTIDVTDTTQEDVHCSLSSNNWTWNKTRRIYVSWIEQFQISAKEVVLKDQSNISVTCLIPTMQPEPNITLRYSGQELLMDKKTSNEIYRNIYTQLMNITKADNGQTVKCCVDIRSAGETCKEHVLNILFPPQDVDISLVRLGMPKVGNVQVECRAGESNPPSTISWDIVVNGTDIEPLNTTNLTWTVEYEKNKTGPNNGLTLSQVISIKNPPPNTLVSCYVTNEKFPDVNLTMTTYIQKEFLEKEELVWVLVASLVGISAVGMLCLVGAGTLFMVKRRRHNQMPISPARRRVVNEAFEREERDIYPDNSLDDATGQSDPTGHTDFTTRQLVYADLDHSTPAQRQVNIPSSYQQVEYVSMAFPSASQEPEPEVEAPYPTEGLDEPGLYSNSECPTESVQMWDTNDVVDVDESPEWPAPYEESVDDVADSYPVEDMELHSN